MEKEVKSLTNDEKNQTEINFSDEYTKVIPAIQEFLTVNKKVVETGKVFIKRRIEEENANINIPLVNEAYKIERIPVKNQIFDAPPPTRYENENMIIPVIREVAEVIIRYEVIEEVHVIKEKSVVPHLQQITLLKENITIERKDLPG